MAGDNQSIHDNNNKIGDEIDIMLWRIDRINRIAWIYQ